VQRRQFTGLVKLFWRDVGKAFLLQSSASAFHMCESIVEMKDRIRDAVITVWQDMLCWQRARICWNDSVPGYAIMTVYQDMLCWQCTRICYNDSVPGYAVMTVYQVMVGWQCTRICCNDSVPGYALMTMYQDVLWPMWDTTAYRLRSVVLIKGPILSSYSRLCKNLRKL
jgi:hypothetical protein